MSESLRSNNSSGSSGSSTILRHRIINNIWRSSSLSNLISNSRRNRVLQSSSADIPSDLKSSQSLKGERNNRRWNAIVTIVVVEAKGLPDPPCDSSAHHVYCKIRLGKQTCKSKSVLNSHNPEWRERLQLYLNNDHVLRISIWDKGKQKNFMGSCIVDLSSLEQERTHEIWQQLDDGFGSVHLNVTICTIRNDNVSSDPEPDLQSIKEEFAFLNLKNSDWRIVGQLSVKVIGARGLSGKPDAYCTLELDNERVQTPVSRAGSEPLWNKNYLFNVYDVTSTLDIRVHDNSLVNSLRMEYLGKISIPLLRVTNGVTRWYALKDKSKRNNAKGNCPRVLLEMTVIWNPVKATIRLFRPKEVKYVKKSHKFDIGLVHSNLEFIRDTFNFIYELNEGYKHFLEWDNNDLSSIFLAVWLIFWYHFELWIVPLLLLLPFLYHLIHQRYEREHYSKYTIARNNLNNHFGNIENEKNETLLHSLTEKIQNLPEMTLTITDGVEFIASLAERFYNLVTFEVPFLSFLTMIFLSGASIILYFIPIKYLLMILGTYKYTRKRLNPQRTPNNDLLDFISRIPDFEMMRDWKELTVPEPGQQRNSAMSTSTYIVH